MTPNAIHTGSERTAEARLPNGVAAATVATPAEQAAVARLLETFGDDRELAAEMLLIFHEELPGMLDKIFQSIEQRDATAARFACHALRGSLPRIASTTAEDVSTSAEDAPTVLDAAPAINAATVVETLTREGRWETAHRVFDQLTVAINTFLTQADRVRDLVHAEPAGG